MRIVLAILAVLVLAVSVSATCTPVTLSKGPNPHDQDTGFNAWFTIHGTNFGPTQYAMATNVYITSTELWIDNAQGSGYIAVLGGFGGCTLNPWSATEYSWVKLVDFTTNSTIYTSTTIGGATNVTCHNSNYCAFPTQSMPAVGSYGPFNLIVGHTYQVQMYIQGKVINVGESTANVELINVIVQ